MIKTFDDFINEELDFDFFKSGSRKDTKNSFMGRKKDNDYAKDIFDEMILDYEKYDKNLRKVFITSEYSTMRYIFGESNLGNYISMGNRKVGDKEIKINAVNVNGAMMEITEWKTNPKHDPNFHLNFGWDDDDDIPYFNNNQENKDKMRIYDVEEEYFYISRDLAKKNDKLFCE